MKDQTKSYSLEWNLYYLSNLNLISSTQVLKSPSKVDYLNSAILEVVISEQVIPRWMKARSQNKVTVHISIYSDVLIVNLYSQDFSNYTDMECFMNGDVVCQSVWALELN